MRLISWISLYWLRILIVLWLISVALWTYATGFSARNIASGAFNSLQFLVLNKDIGDIKTSGLVVWGLIAMQFLLPMLASIGLIKNLFQNQLEPFYAKLCLKFKKDHIVIIGCGPVGLSISKAFCNNSDSADTVLIVDKNSENDCRTTLNDINKLNKKAKQAIWLHGDITDKHVLNAIKLEKARKIFICMGNDSQNLKTFREVNTALAATTYIPANSSRIDSPAHVNKNKRPEIYIQLVSDAARDALRDPVGWQGLAQGLPHDNISGFDMHELAAREIFNRYLPDMLKDTDHENSISQTIIIVGASAMAKALIRRSGRLGHFSSKGKLQVLWADPNVEEVATTLYAECPNLNPNVKPFELKLPENPDNSEILPSIYISTVSDHITNVLRQSKIAELSNQKLPSVVFVCHEDEAKNADQAREICAFYNRTQTSKCNKSKPVVAVQFNQKYGLSHDEQHNQTSVVQSDQKNGLSHKKPDENHQTELPHPHNGLAFRTDEILITDAVGEVLIDNKKDKLASYFNTVIYSKKDSSKCSDEWIDLKEFLKESNRDAADHLAIKLHHLVPSNNMMKRKTTEEDYLRVNEALRTHASDLSFIEHKRYCAFMFTAGFSFGAPKHLTITDSMSRKDLERLVRVNATLIPYSNLASNEQEKDKEMVLHIIGALAFRDN